MSLRIRAERWAIHCPSRVYTVPCSLSTGIRAAGRNTVRHRRGVDLHRTSSIRDYLGAFAVELGGLDAISFTGGIGEHSSLVRGQVLAGLEFLGVELDPAKNEAVRGEGSLHAAGSRVRLRCCAPTRSGSWPARPSSCSRAEAPRTGPPGLRAARGLSCSDLRAHQHQVAESLTEQITAVSGQVSSVQKHVQGLDQQMDGLAQRLGKLEGQADSQECEHHQEAAVIGAVRRITQSKGNHPWSSPT